MTLQMILLLVLVITQHWSGNYLLQKETPIKDASYKTFQHALIISTVFINTFKF